MSTEYTDLDCHSPEAANEVWAYLKEQVKEQEERSSIVARVYKSTLRITYENVGDRREWDMQLMGFRDGYEAAKRIAV